MDSIGSSSGIITAKSFTLNTYTLLRIDDQKSYWINGETEFDVGDYIKLTYKGVKGYNSSFMFVTSIAGRKKSIS